MMNVATSRAVQVAETPIYDLACAKLAECAQVDEALDIADKHVALEVYYRQAQNTEAERACLNIRLRAERRVGELLAELEQEPGKRSDLTSPDERERLQPSPYAQTLADLKITTQKASQYQRLAEVPEPAFEAALQAPEKPTTAKLVKLAPPKPAPKVLAKPVRRAPVLDDVRERAAAMLLDGQPRSAVSKVLGVSDTVLRAVQSEIDGGLLNAPALNLTQQQKVDRAIQAGRIKMRAEMEGEIRQRIVDGNRKYLEFVEGLEREAERVKGYYEVLVNRHRPPFTADEFMLLHLCVRGDASEEKRHRAGVLLNEKRTVLTGQK